MIEWRCSLYDLGNCVGIGGRAIGTDAFMAVRLGKIDQVTPEQIISAAQKIEFAIRLQLEAAEKKAKASKLPGFELGK